MSFNFVKEPFVNFNFVKGPKKGSEFSLDRPLYLYDANKTKVLPQTKLQKKINI